MALGLYAYGVIAADALDQDPDLRGIEPSRPVTLKPVGSLAAAVSEVEISQFEGAALERNVAQQGWLESKVRAHQTVLDALIQRTTVVPMRFGSIFSTDDALEQMLRDQTHELGACLELVRGKTEWGVKLHCDPAELVSERSGSSSEESGKEYLLRRRAELHTTEEVSAEAGAVADELHTSLAAIADRAAIILSDRSRTERPILNAAYLVRDDLRDLFMSAVHTLQQRHPAGYLIEVTGPWPPYNFTTVNVAGPRS